MPEQDKVNRWVMKPEKLATSKQRRFLRLLNSNTGYIPRGTTRGEIAKIIGKFSKEQIARARERFKLTRPATKYMKALGVALGYLFTGYTREQALGYLNTTRFKNPEVYKAAKAKVRGMTYEKRINK